MVPRINNTSSSGSSRSPHRTQSCRIRGNNNNKKKAGGGGVRFAPDERLCDYHSKFLKELTNEICENVWYQQTEFEELQDEIRRTSSSAVRKGLSAYVDRTYGYNDEKTQDMYNLWARCSDTRRGLERFVNEEYGRTRKQIQRKTVHAVLYTQDRLRNDKECCDDYSRSSQIISNVSTKISADAIAYAAMMGKADSAAVMTRRQRPQKKPVVAGSTIVRRIPSINRRNATTTTTTTATKMNNNTVGGRSSSPSKFVATGRSTTPSKFAAAQKQQQKQQQQQPIRPLVRRKPVMLQHYKPVVFQPYSSTSKKEINEDDSENSDTVPIVKLSPEQQRAKKEKRDQQQLLEHANFGRSGKKIANFGSQRKNGREISWVPRR